MPAGSRKRQTRISFEALPSSSPAKGTYSTAVRDRLASVRFEGLTPRQSMRPTRSHNTTALPTPEPSSQPQAHLETDPSRYNDILGTSTRGKFVNSSDISGQETEDEDDIILPSSKRRRVVGKEEDIFTPTRKPSRLNKPETPQSNLIRRSKTSRSTDMSSISSPETSGDDEDVVITKPVLRRSTGRKELEDDPFVISDNDVKEEARSSVRKSGKASSRDSRIEKDFVVADDEVEFVSSGDGDTAPVKSRSSKSKKRRTRHEQNELDEDLEDLKTSDMDEQEDFADSRRTRGGPVTTKRDRAREHLEILKRRRAGEKVPRITDGDENQSLGIDEYSEVDIDEITREEPIFNHRTQRHAQTVISSSDEDEDHQLQGQADDEGEDEDDFIEYDDEDMDSSSRHDTKIPIELTRYASMKPRELFRYIIEWLVKNKIAPAFSRSDELYMLSFSKVNDQINAQAGSRLISSAWSADFKYAVLARPQMTVNYTSTGDDESFLDCSACNKTNHPARYEFKFEGRAYHKDTLEPLDDEDDDNEEEESTIALDEQSNDKASYDAAGHLLPSANTTYYLGRVCAANAEMGHKLTHWKYHLNELLLAYLEEQGVLSAEAIVAREKLSKRRREQEAENIVDVMEDTKVIADLWRNLQDDLEDARFGMEDHVARGGKRSKNRIGKVRIG